MPKPPKLGKITFSSLPLQEQIQMSNLQDAVNILGGHSGEVELSNHLNLSGNKIKNVGAAQEPKDVVTSEVAEANYSARALRPKLEAAGEASLRTFITGLKGDVTASGPGIAQSTVGNVTGVNFSQIVGNLALTQLPTAGVSGTVTLAKLTPTGANGSLTFQNGLLTATVNPT
jgi:hypothetical protein